MSPLPIRVRVSAAFALAMAVVLAGSGLFLYLRLSAHLSLALDRELQLRAQDLAALVSQSRASLARESGSRMIERGESYAQLVAPDGRVLDATQPLGRAPLLAASELRAAHRAPIYMDEPSVPGLNEPSRILATTVRRNGRPLVLVVGATLQDRAETLAGYPRRVADRRPDRADPRHRRRLSPRRPVAEAGRLDAPARVGDLR